MALSDARRVSIDLFIYSVAQHNVRVYKARAPTADVEQFLRPAISLWGRFGFPSCCRNMGPSPIADYPRHFNRCLFTLEGRIVC